MKFTRLRLSGFKSFVEPTDLLIEPGLTGVVGPNGCGKSNLLEALRWVMGESSYKSMRAAGMDDVIFSGTTQRPSRNMAEVVVTMANEDRSAPPQHNDNDVIEITRRIEREAGSAYRINGRDVRARDVQLLFADVSTGARSPALVRQGQIGEIINAKPQARRLILEEAAGITGLHTRRHEAELKLKAAEQNLVRLEDVTSQLETQLNSLKRQARQAVKYKQISAEIRKLEAAGLYAAWKEAADQAERDSATLDDATRELAEHTRAASEKLRHRDELGEKLPGLREQEAMRAAALQRLTLERNALDEEERRTEARAKELQLRIDQIDADLSREQELLGDTERVIERLSGEDAALKSTNEQESELRVQAATALQLAAESLARSQEAADQAAAKLSELTARRNAILRTIEEQSARIARFEREAAEAGARRETLLAQFSTTGDGVILADAVENALATASASELAANEAEASVRVARQSESEVRGSFEEARRRAEALQTEVRTLHNLLKADSGGLWPPLVDAIQVRRGYETALGAALGDDMEASADEAAPAHWRGLPQLDEVATLPFGAEPLAQFVAAPPALARRIAHIGIVPRGIGQALQPQLKPGQRLVSREGDIWRWDGFTVATDAPSAAANRLAERNRLSQLETSMAEAVKAAEERQAQFEAAGGVLVIAIAQERSRRDEQRAAISTLEFARRGLANHERQEAERLAQTASLDEAIRRIDISLSEGRAQLESIQGEAAALPIPDTLQAGLAQLRETLDGERAQYAESRSKHDGLEREARARGDRIAAIASELGQWSERTRRAQQQIEQLKSRQGEILAAINALVSLPQQLAEKRARLMDALSEAEDQRREAADALASGENAVRQADAELRTVQEQQSKSREEHARLESRLEGTRQRQTQCEHRINETLQCRPHDILSGAGIEPDKVPAPEQIEKLLLGLRDDRERLGAVNLRADEEAAAVGQQLETLVRERDDLVKAINKLRGGISSLNREGRQRLLDAFGTVNEKFGELFMTLFDGGKAELQLVESDDPLEAGLEIVANPPGKKPTTISLLSGGEQTLTALSLIFAVFLTNPSPICVLDEVDAPLDDHNVERFCNLLDAMLERTDTRFLIITHHPLTMARMNRLFGVTMMERGVSQLVSVNLQEAEALKEAS